MGLDAGAIKQGLDAIAAQDERIARALMLAGYPEARIRPTGYATLLRTIVGQQVSVAAAASASHSKIRPCRIWVSAAAFAVRSR